MGASDKRRIVLVSRKTRLQELTERFNTWPQAKFYLEHNQVDAGELQVVGSCAASGKMTHVG